MRIQIDSYLFTDPWGKHHDDILRVVVRNLEDNALDGEEFLALQEAMLPKYARAMHAGEHECEPVYNGFTLVIRRHMLAECKEDLRKAKREVCTN